MFEIIRSSFVDSEIARNYTNNRTKSTAIINNVTGSEGFERTVQLINGHWVQKNLALVVRLVANNNKVEDIYLALQPAPNVTSEALYKIIVDFLENNTDYKKQ